MLLASDITAQAEIRDVLENAGLACAFFQVDTFADYTFMMEQLCAVTGREEDVYKRQGLAVVQHDDGIGVPDGGGPLGHDEHRGPALHLPDGPCLLYTSRCV